MDRRTRRTRTALADGLIATIRDHGWKRTTVSAVAARADVGRATFYEHFPHREALLAEVITDRVRRLCQPDGGGDLDLESLVAHCERADLAPFLDIPAFRDAAIDALIEALAGQATPTAARFAAAGLLELIPALTGGAGRDDVRREAVSLMEAAISSGDRRHRLGGADADR